MVEVNATSGAHQLCMWISWVGWTCQLLPTVLPTLRAQFYRKHQVKTQYWSVSIVADDYSVFA